MATQDFVDGGFYGKLGMMVGQRWHNKRYIRTWVKGTNPNTPAQQETRGFFRQAVALAQQAYNLNKGHKSWASENNNEFSLRVGTAKRRLQKGMMDWEALPLFPDGYLNEEVTTFTGYEFDETSEKMTLSFMFDEDTSNYVFKFILNTYNRLTDTYNQVEIGNIPGGPAKTHISFDFQTSAEATFYIDSWVEGEANAPDIVSPDMYVVRFSVFVPNEHAYSVTVHWQNIEYEDDQFSAFGIEYELPLKIEAEGSTRILWSSGPTGYNYVDGWITLDMGGAYGTWSPITSFWQGEGSNIQISSATLDGYSNFPFKVRFDGIRFIWPYPWTEVKK